MQKRKGPGSPEPSQEPIFNNGREHAQHRKNKEDLKSRLHHKSRCRNKRRWPGQGPNPSLFGACSAWRGQGSRREPGTSRSRLPPCLGRQKGCRLNCTALGLCSSTDGTVNLKYSTGGRQMGISREGSEPGIRCGINRALHPYGAAPSFAS